MYNPDEARDSEGRWTNSFEGSKAILEAASGKKQINPTVESIKTKNKKVLGELESKGYEFHDDITKHLDPKTKIKIDKKDKGFYSDEKKEINLPETPYNSFFKKKVAIHESAHAWHYNEKIITDNSVRDDFKNVFSDLQSKIKGREFQIQRDLEKLKGPYNDPVYHTQITAFQDTLLGLTKGEFGQGHTKEYMKTANLAQMEVFAHGVEFYKLNFNLYNALPSEMRQVHDGLIAYIKQII